MAASKFADLLAPYREAPGAKVITLSSVKAAAEDR